MPYVTAHNPFSPNPSMGTRKPTASDEPGHVASAYFVFVAIDEEGHPRPVPHLETETAADVRRRREAEIRRAHRLARKAEIDQGREDREA